MTVVRTVVVGLAVLLVMTVATGLVVTGSAPGSWVVHLTLLAPMLAGLAATLAHPGPHVCGWPAFVAAVAVVPVVGGALAQMAAAAAPGDVAGPGPFAVLGYLSAAAAGVVAGLTWRSRSRTRGAGRSRRNVWGHHRARVWRGARLDGRARPPR